MYSHWVAWPEGSQPNRVPEVSVTLSGEREARELPRPGYDLLPNRTSGRPLPWRWARPGPGSATPSAQRLRVCGVRASQGGVATRCVDRHSPRQLRHRPASAKR